MRGQLSYAASARNDLEHLDPNVARRILDKLDWYVMQENPLRFAEHLTDSPHGEYRFRVGDYRVLFDVRRGIIIVLEILRIKHRREVYK
ncbi:MAG: type II toxin-antitoxin system RelE/ParE family toxin [Patescibacteria group bacterium]